MKLNKLYECGKNGGVSTVSTTMAPLVSTELPGVLSIYLYERKYVKCFKKS